MCLKRCIVVELLLYLKLICFSTFALVRALNSNEMGEGRGERGERGEGLGLFSEGLGFS